MRGGVAVDGQCPNPKAISAPQTKYHLLYSAALFVSTVADSFLVTRRHPWTSCQQLSVLHFSLLSAVMDTVRLVIYTWFLMTDCLFQKFMNSIYPEYAG